MEGNALEYDTDICDVCEQTFTVGTPHGCWRVRSDWKTELVERATEWRLKGVSVIGVILSMDLRLQFKARGVLLGPMYREFLVQCHEELPPGCCELIFNDGSMVGRSGTLARRLRRNDPPPV